MSLSAVRSVSRSSPATAAVIFFHGLGDSGSGWQFFADMARQSSEFDHINFVFPNAPTQSVTVNGGNSMPSWFDIQRFGEWTNNDDVDGYLKSLETVGKYIDEQITNGITPDRIIVGGFSQGGGLALGTLALHEKKIGGILAFSPAVPFFKLLKDEKLDVNINTPVFHGHGTADPVIPIHAGNADVELFKELGFKNYTYKTYPGLQHSCHPEELETAFDFIRKIAPRE
jgi:predicted esterase